MFIRWGIAMSGKKKATKRVDGFSELDLNLQDILDSVEDELLIIDGNYHIQFANPVIASRLQKKILTGDHCYEVFQSSERPCNSPTHFDCPFKKVFDNGNKVVIMLATSVSGVEKYLKITAYPLRDSEGNIVAIAELRRDITAERNLEIQILRRYHQLQALSNISNAVTSLLDLDGILKIALDNVLEVINGTVGGILLLDEENETLYYRVQRGLSARFTEEMRIPVGKGIAGSVLKTGKPILAEDISKDRRTVRPDLINSEGLRGFMSIPLKSKDKVLGVMNIASADAGRFGSDDMSLINSIADYLGTAIEQANLYRRLTQAGERYKRLLQHSLTAQEEERKRIARELHDETSQAITSLTLSLQASIQLAEMKDFSDTDFIGKLKKTHAFAVHAGNEIVKLMKELRPTLLDELGMVAAIQRYAKDTFQTKGIDVSFTINDADKRLPPEIEVTLFRITQGAIGNILEHSEAKNTHIGFDCDSQSCQLSISDDGKGFDVSKITRIDPRGRGAGLFTIKERARLVGGDCRIDSEPGKGTRITVTIPLEKDLLDEKYQSTDSRRPHART
jgi:signal transduction histidine kinase